MCEQENENKKMKNFNKTPKINGIQSLEMVNNKIYFKYRKKKVNKIDAPTTKYRSFFLSRIEKRNTNGNNSFVVY